MNALRKATMILLVLQLLFSIGVQAQTPVKKKQQSQPAAITPQAGAPLVQGSGTIGKLPKWTYFSGYNYTLGDSVISESASGNIGIGTPTPTSKLSVQGMIETTLGGVKFPDGTVQTTAVAGGMQTVFHNATLTGNGTQGSPLGVAVPLVLSGPGAGYGLPALKVTNTAVHGPGLDTRGGPGTDDVGGTGLIANGGHSDNSAGGTGALIYAGNSDNLIGGTGSIIFGGSSSNFNGGEGLIAYGGNSLAGGNGGRGLSASGGMAFNGNGGEAIFASGGNGNAGNGGVGLTTSGGTATGAGHTSGTGILAYGGVGDKGAANGLAGSFNGTVEVSGNFNVIGGGTKNFKIDHPLDPENKYLYHAAIESSEVLNIYSGNVTTDENGDAVVALPDWFETLNRDFRYQLTVVGTFAQAIVGNKVKGNRFAIKTSAPNVEVSWQVTGIRSDAAIRKHPFQVEENKPQSERGTYLTPEAYDQPEERGVNWARHPQTMQQLKQQRTKAEQTKPVDR